jgi:hypothetical protein
MTKKVENKLEPYKYFDIIKLILNDKRQNSLYINYENPYYFFKIKNESTLLIASNHDNTINNLYFYFNKIKENILICIDLKNDDKNVFSFSINIRYVSNIMFVYYDGEKQYNMQDSMSGIGDILTTIGYLMSGV